MALRLKTDWILFATVLGMISFGLLILYSASSINAEMDPHFGWSGHFVVLQLVWAALAVTAMMALKRTDYRTFNSAGVAFGAISVALLLLVLVYFVDPHHRWLRFFGSFGLQPSELAKPALVIFLAFFVTWRGPAINSRRHTLLPAAMMVGFVIFWVVRADLGTAIVLGSAAAMVFFTAGLEWRYCAIAGAIAFAGVVFFICAEPYRLARVVHFADPHYKIVESVDHSGRVKAWIEQSLAARDTNYQQEQALIALGDGGVLGRGLMNGQQKVGYLPKVHTDFIYAVVGEELGLFGSIGLLAGFGVILWRGLRAAWTLKDDFGRFLALGITVIIVVQALINMSTVLGLIPTKGIPLPMVSYGGSSLLSTLVLLGMLMNVSEYAG
jgi:cell division protein FtsW